MNVTTTQKVFPTGIPASPPAGGDVAAAVQPAAVPAEVLREKLGVCQWFHFEDYDAVRQTVALLKELNVRHLRTGVSWADFYRPGGKKWYDWQMSALGDFDVLLSVWHTPPSIA